MRRLTMLDEGVKIALDSIRGNKIRSGLTILGVSIGVGVIVMIAALVTGIQSSIMDGFESAGPDNFAVMRFDFSAVRLSFGSRRPPWWNKPRIEPEEAERLARLPAIREALYSFDFNATMAAEGRRVNAVPSYGYSSGWPAYSPGTFVAGRGLHTAGGRPIPAPGRDLPPTRRGALRRPGSGGEENSGHAGQPSRE